MKQRDNIWGIWKNEKKSLENKQRPSEQAGRLIASSRYLFRVLILQRDKLSLIMFNLLWHQNCRRPQKRQATLLAWHIGPRLFPSCLRGHATPMWSSPPRCGHRHPDVVIATARLPEPRTRWKWHCLPPPAHSAVCRHPHLLSSIPRNHSLMKSFPGQLLLFGTKTELIHHSYLPVPTAFCL